MKPDILKYVRTTANANMVQFVLNASNKPQRDIASTLLRFDPGYFAQEFLSIKHVKRNQIKNLLHYCGVELIPFPCGEFFSYLVFLLSITAHSDTKRPLSRRLLTVFVYVSGKSRELADKALSLLSCDVGGPRSYEVLRQTKASDLLELYYETLMIGRMTRCEQVVASLIRVLTKTTVYGIKLSLLFNILTAESVALMVQSFIPSINLVPFHYFAERPAAVTGAHIVALVAFRPAAATSRTNYGLLKFGFQFGNNCLNPADSSLSRKEKKKVLGYYIEVIDRGPNSASLRHLLKIFGCFMNLLGPKSR
jgi:hypothetical protein